VGTYYTEETSGPTRDAVEDVVLGWPDVTAEKLFGCPSYRAAGKLFAFVSDEGLVLTNLTEPERAKADAELGPEPAVELAGRSAKWRFVAVGEEDAAQVAPFLRMAYERALKEADE
jgi:hypothetical protein